MGYEIDDSEPPSTSPTVRLTSSESMKAHAALFVGLLFCAAAFFFEIRRALAGNGLSWAYVVEWPLLAGFAIYMWWHTLHPTHERPSVAPSQVAPEFEGMRAAWHEHQRELHQSGDVSGAGPPQ